MTTQTAQHAGSAAPELLGQTAIVTGGAVGIGRGIAIELASRRADIVIADVNEVEGRNAAQAVLQTGRRALFIQTDVAEQSSTDSMAVATLKEFGRVDILVNNAGVLGEPGWHERDRFTAADWDAVFKVNVFGVVHSTKSVESHMVQRKQGKIVNIASIAGRLGRGGSAHYSASKAAAINVTQAYALRLAKSNINVNCVAPGALWTPLSVKNFEKRRRMSEPYRLLSSREVFEKFVSETVPLRREQTPEDIGKVCAFLVSERARNITGQTINVNGGAYMS